MSDDDRIQYVVDEPQLFDVYELLSEATEAAAAGNPNKCASKAADAKDRLEEVHSDGALLSEVTDE
jgi:hypothetical protein